MKQTIIGVIVGALSGTCTYAASIYVLARTSALVMPREFPLAVWQALVVFGLGAFAIALAIHVFAIHLSSAKALPSLAGFLATLIATLAISGLLASAHEALLAWSLGAVLASALCMWLRSNLSPKRTRERPRAA
jgi:hypothetical protein